MSDLLDPEAAEAPRGRTRDRRDPRALRHGGHHQGPRAALRSTPRPAAPPGGRIPTIRATTPVISSWKAAKSARRCDPAPRPCRAPGRSRSAPHAARATGGHRPGRYRPRRRARCAPRAGPPRQRRPRPASITSRPAAAPKRSPSTTSGRGWPGRACASIASCGIEWQSISTASPNSARLSSIKPAQRLVIGVPVAARSAPAPRAAQSCRDRSPARSPPRGESPPGPELTRGLCGARTTPSISAGSSSSAARFRSM